MKKVFAIVALLFSPLVYSQSGTQAGPPLTAFNTSILISAVTTTSSTGAAFSTNFALPVVLANAKRYGQCDLIIKVSSASATVALALNTSATSTAFYVLGTQVYPTVSSANILLPLTAAVTTAVTTPIMVGQTFASTSAFYQIHTAFVLQTNTNAQTISVFGETSTGTLTLEPGSSCMWTL
jgi:hypothetical protein